MPAPGPAPDRSSRLTRITASAMISISAMMPAETRKSLENPVASAWWYIWVCNAVV
jgi:hypothetical protein